MKKLIPRPFMKWAGGKEQLLNQISLLLPAKFHGYFEPFVGGGAVFFYLYRSKLLHKEVFLSDSNRELITTYRTIRDSVEDLISELKSGIYQPNRSDFERIRFWDRKPSWEKIENIKRTARMIYLNKTCYNGLYRVNQKNQFNVPFGRYKNPTICDSENLRAVSQALQGVNLLPTDFAEATKNAERKDFIYFDPPYHPINHTSNFTEYTSGGFGIEEQKRLAELFRELDKQGCLLLQSNSSTKLIYELYSKENFFIKRVKARRAISCDPKGRGTIFELLIRNYENLVQKTL